MTHPPRPRAAILAIILAHLATGALYVGAVPPWEAPDEPWHLAYAEAVAQGRLPSPGETYEHHQPPLYYAWPAFAVRVLGLPAVPRAPDNPRYPLAVAAYLHPPDDRGAASLALLRAFSGLLGALVVALAWATARAAFASARGSDRTVRGPAAAMAAIVVALLPQFVFIAHTISNDTLATLCGALATYGLVAWVGGAARRDRRALACVCAGLALGLVTKLNVLPIVAVVPLAVVARFAREARGRASARRPAARAAGAVALVAGTLALAWAAVRAAWPTVADALLADTVGRGLRVRPELAEASVVVDQTRRMIGSLAGRFGWANIIAPWGVRAAFGAAGLVALVGLPRGARRGATIARSAVVVAASVVMVVAAAAVRNLMSDPQPQARFLFPALAALALLLAAGWSAWGRGRVQRAWGTVVIGALVALNLWVTQGLLPRSYAGSRVAPAALDTRLVPVAPAIAARLTRVGDVARQTFRVQRAGLRRIEIAAAGVEGSVRVRLRLLDARDQALGETEVDLAGARPNTWFGLDVGPVADSAGRDFALEITHAAGDGLVLLWGTADGAEYPDGDLTVNGGAETDLAFVTVVSGDPAPSAVPPTGKAPPAPRR